MILRITICFLSLIIIPFAQIAQAGGSNETSYSVREFDRLFNRAAKTHGVSEAVLRSICRIESKGNPYAININGIGFQPHNEHEALGLLLNTEKRPWLLTLNYSDEEPHYSFFRTRKDAQNALNEVYSNNRRWYVKNPKANIRKLDMRSVDIGLMQINHLFHGRHFPDKASLFNPETNIFYAAKYLRKLLDRHGTLKDAVAHYHSNTEKYQAIYLSQFWPIYQKLIGNPSKV